MFRSAFWMVPALLILMACNRPVSTSNPGDVFNADSEESDIGEFLEVIYAMDLPTDITRLFEETGTSFDPDLLIPVEKTLFFEQQGEVALLTGILGVDLSYCRLYGRMQESSEYYRHIEILADKLGLPGEIFERSSSLIELYMDEPDSLAGVIDELYGEVDSYFKSNDQGSLASLSLLGGWLEAMYIAVKLYQEKSVLEVGDGILQQKYTLNSLTGVLGDYQESLTVRRFMHQLNRLREIYERVEIRYSRDGFEIDPEENLMLATESEIVCDAVTLDELCTTILRIREEIL